MDIDTVLARIRLVLSSWKRQFLSTQCAFLVSWLQTGDNRLSTPLSFSDNAPAWDVLANMVKVIGAKYLRQAFAWENVCHLPATRVHSTIAAAAVCQQRPRAGTLVT